MSAKFGTCTVVIINGTLVEDKMRGFKGECAHFSFNKHPIYTHEGASAKFSTNSQETDNSVCSQHSGTCIFKIRQYVVNEKYDIIIKVAVRKADHT